MLQRLAGHSARQLHRRIAAQISAQPALSKCSLARANGSSGGACRPPACPMAPPRQLPSPGQALLARHCCPTAQPARGFAVRAAAGRKKADVATFAEPEGNGAADERATKAAGLQAAMKALNKKYGENAVRTLADNSVSQTEYMSTGALTLDLALGGGFPRGGIVEIFGPESTGKTSLALSAVAQAQRKGAVCAFVDLEHALSQDFAQKLGVRLDQLVISQPSSGDEALDIVAQLAGSSGGVEMIVVDSVAALIPRNELEGDIGMPTMGSMARLMSSGLRILAPLASKHKCCIVFINQIRFKVGVVYGSPETTPGGMALKYTALQRIDLRKKATIPLAKEKEQTGITIRAKVVKNKVGSPGKACEYDFMFESGINSAGCLLDVAEKLQLAQRKGSWYYIDDVQIAQGKERTLDHLNQHPDMAEALEQKVWQALADKRNVQAVESMVDDDDPAELEAEAQYQMASM